MGCILNFFVFNCKTQEMRTIIAILAVVLIIAIWVTSININFLSLKRILIML